MIRKIAIGLFLFVLVTALGLLAVNKYAAGRTIWGHTFSIPDVPLQTKSELFELRLGYRQNLDMIAQLEDDQRKLDEQISSKLAALPKGAVPTDEIIDLRGKWKQDADTIKAIKEQYNPSIDAAWEKKVADAVKAAHLPDAYTVSVPNNLREIKFALKPKPEAEKK